MNTASTTKDWMKHALVAAVATAAVAGAAAIASADNCANSCITVAIPSAEGVVTKLDGSADAALWPPSQELRTIRISALNNRNAPCDVTINDVLQDEKPALTSSGVPIDDAAACVNDSLESTVKLRSTRDAQGNGRSYHVLVSLADPDCTKTAKEDEILVAVPRDEKVTSLRPDADVNNLMPSYNGDVLACVPEQVPDRLAALQ